MTFLVDTTVLIDVLRGDEAIRERLTSLTDPPYVSAASVHEVIKGMRPDERPGVEKLLSWVRVVPIGELEARISGHWRRVFALKGRKLGELDAMIAACAFTCRVPLATANVKHFPMEEVTVEHWPSSA